MEIPSMNLNEISFGFIEMLQPLMAITLAMVIALALKDWAGNLVAGLRFKWSESWWEGQPCYVDGEPAIIIKISVSETIFAIQNGRGTVWRHVSNDRIKFLKIERCIDKKPSGNANKSRSH